MTVSTPTVPTDADALRERVRERYAASARQVATGSASCCGSTPTTNNSITSDLYAIDETLELPEAAVLASLGCGNPTALADLRPGETVLDLGSGGGIDVLLSARRIGPTGFAYGLDMTDEMLDLAERNRAAASAENVRFLKGHIEAIPLPEASLDVILSNCVINLSADKRQVLAEAFRVLRPGGRFAVSDIVTQGTLPDAVRESMDAWSSCVAGALEEGEYRQLLAEAGFTDIAIEVTRAHAAEDLASSLSGDVSCCGDSPAPMSLSVESIPQSGQIVSAFIRAQKPVRED